MWEALLHALVGLSVIGWNVRSGRKKYAGVIACTSFHAWLYYIHAAYTIYLDTRKLQENSSLVPLSLAVPRKEVTTLGREIKDILNSLTEGVFRTVKMHGVTPVERKPTDVSRGSGRLRALNAHLNIKDFGSVVEIGAGAGGWTNVVTEEYRHDEYHAFSLWHLIHHEKSNIRSPLVKCHSMEAQHIRPRYCNTLLYDAGETHVDYDQEIRNTLRHLDIAERWLTYHPDNFIIRVINVGNDDVLAKLMHLQSITGKGSLIRLADDRNSYLGAYFVSQRGDIPSQVTAICDHVYSQIMDSKDLPPTPREGERTGIRSYWETVPDLPVPKLQMLDMTDTIKWHKERYRTHTPINTFHFMKELFWYPSTFTGTSSESRNPFVNALVRRLAVLMHDFGTWRTTSTTPQSTYKTIKDKIDHAPRENHKHHALMFACYRAIADYLLGFKPRLRMLTDQELYESINRKGHLGIQDAELGLSSLGDYIDQPGLWKPRVQRFREALMKGRPIMGDYNSIGKRERKQKSSSRLIWFLCGTARIFEAQVFGKLDSMLKNLPTSVSGLPIYDYGAAISRIMKPGMAAVCDDVAGWDTKVSYSMLCMESYVAEKLSATPEHAALVRQLYRLYAYPMVNITRPHQGHTQNVLCQIQGQVASGRRVTYPFNTISNTAVTGARALYSRGITDPEEAYRQFSAWLRKGHSDDYGGKISGDDSVIIMSKENAIKYATIGYKFMNDIGMPRKNIPENQPSDILTTMEEIDFCSHSFTQVEFPGGHKRWMPVRGVDEILAKATITLSSDFSVEKKMAWARAQGLNLITNYFHLPSVRLVGLALLSATPNNISLSSELEGWSYRGKPWIKQGDVLSIVNECLFGESTHDPVDYRLSSLSDLPTVNYFTRRRFEVNTTRESFANWRKNLPQAVRRLRTEYGVSDSHSDWWIQENGHHGM